jgi:hypothetical protein
MARRNRRCVHGRFLADLADLAESTGLSLGTRRARTQFSSVKLRGYLTPA